MDILSAIAAARDGWASEDALRVLGRVADAFDSPPVYRTEEELLFVVNMVKSRRLLTSLPSEESVCQDTTYGSYDSSLDSSYDEDVEVSILEYASSPERHQLHEPRSFSERIFRKDTGVYDVTQMLLTSSPLDRLDRLARMELKKTGWFERTDKWSVVEMGLQGTHLPMTPPRNAAFHVGGSWERSSLTKTRTPPGGEKQTPRASRRSETNGGQLPGTQARSHDTPERDQYQGDTTKSSVPTSTQSTVRSQESDSHPIDFATPFKGDVQRSTGATPIRAPRLSRTPVHPRMSQQQTRGRLGQVVRNFVKRMLPPSSGGGPSTSNTAYAWVGAYGDSPSARTCHAEMTPRSDTSKESAWTFGSANSWCEARTQGCLDCQTTSRWSGFWH